MIASFDIELFDLPKERITKRYRAVLELHETHIHTHYHFECEQAEDEDKLTWKPKRYNSRLNYLRSQLGSVNFFYSNDALCWTLEIECAGTAESIEIRFLTTKEGFPVYQAVLEYMLNSKHAHGLA